MKLQPAEVIPQGAYADRETRPLRVVRVGTVHRSEGWLRYRTVGAVKCGPPVRMTIERFCARFRNLTEHEWRQLRSPWDVERTPATPQGDAGTIDAFGAP